MQPCFSCAAPTVAAVRLRDRAVPLCTACLLRLDAYPSARKRKGAFTPDERIAAHDARVLAAIRAKPDASWRDIMRASKVGSVDARLARERLLASGRIVELCAARGYLGARYAVADNPPGLPAMEPDASDPS